MSHSNFYIGIDGGGTKTAAIIGDENGVVVGRGVTGGANPHNFPLDIAFENIRQAVLKAQKSANENGKLVKISDVKGVCIGLAGIDTKVDRDRITNYIRNLPKSINLFNNCKLILCNDGYIGLKSATNETWGITLISSTGSNCYGVNQFGDEASAGDWGYLLGDQGSGFNLGIKIIRRVIEEYDGRAAISHLTPLVLKQLNLKNTTDLMAWAYNGPIPVKEISSLCQILNEAQFEELSFIFEFVSETATALINSYKAVVHRLQMDDTAFPVALVGGLFKLKFPLKDKVTQGIIEITPNAKVITSTLTPDFGALKVAQLDTETAEYPKSLITVID